MKKIGFLCACFLFGMGLFSSCNKKQEAKSTTVSQIDTISVTFGLDTTLVLDKNVKNGYVMNLSIKGEFPKNPTLRQELINECFSDSSKTVASNDPQEVLVKYRDYLLDDFKKSFANDSVTDDSLQSDTPKECHYEQNVYRVCYMSNELASYCMEYDGYNYGAAHGYHGIKYFTFDLKNNKRITESSIFVSGYQEKLNALLLKYMMEQYGARDFSDLLEKRLLLVDKENILPNDNFSVSPQGITYCFNEYEISAYAAGDTKVTIPFYELKGLVKESSPLYKYCSEDNF